MRPQRRQHCGQAVAVIFVHHLRETAGLGMDARQVWRHGQNSAPRTKLLERAVQQASQLGCAEFPVCSAGSTKQAQFASLASP
jgi:hypothetical protein